MCIVYTIRDTYIRDPKFHFFDENKRRIIYIYNSVAWYIILYRN